VPKPDYRDDRSVPVSAFAISFPASETRQLVSYQVNVVHQEEQEDLGGDLS
jgi:hypothetical protein